MAVCYITQLEIYPSNPQIDTLDIAKVDDAVNLLDDLNYIRSVIRAILGPTAKRWNDVEFIQTKSLEKVWSSVSSCCGDPTTSIPGFPPSQTTSTTVLLDYTVNGMIPTANFTAGETIFSHVFSRKTFLNSISFGRVYAEVGPQDETVVDGGNTFIKPPADVEFAVFNKNDKIIGKFTFYAGKNTAQIERVGAIQEFLPGDTIKIASISSSFYGLENLSFYMTFATSEFFASTQGQLFDLYAYVNNVNSVISAEEIEEVVSTKYTYKLFQHRTLNPFLIQQTDPGYVTVTKPVPSSAVENTELGIYKTDPLVTRKVGTITLYPGTKLGKITMTEPVTSFNPDDYISVRAENNTQTPPTVTFDGLTLNFKTIYNLKNRNFEEGFFGFIQGNLVDSKTIFSVVVNKPTVFNLNNSIFSVQNFPQKLADIEVYKNTTRVGTIQFSPSSRFAQNKVPEVQLLQSGDCLYFKTIENTAGTTPPNTTPIKDLTIILLPSATASVSIN